MWDKDKEKGILCDFDLATLRNNFQKRGREPTGTTPFMAVDLLVCDYFDGKVQRHYRHDLESFVWVLIWVSMEDNSEWENQFWDTSTYYVICHSDKLAFLSNKHCLVMSIVKERDRWSLVLDLVKWVSAMVSPYDSTLRDKGPKETYDDVMAIIDNRWVWGD